jgi:hypothetical protein
MSVNETTTDRPVTDTTRKTRRAISQAVTKVRETSRRARHISLGLVGLALDSAQIVASRSESRGRRLEREIKSQREELTERVEKLRKEAGDTLMHTSDQLAERGQSLVSRLKLRPRTYSAEVTQTETVEVSIEVEPSLSETGTGPGMETSTESGTQS